MILLCIKIYRSTFCCMILLVFGYLCFTRQCSDIVGVVCMPMNSKFLTESTGEKLLKLINIQRRYGVDKVRLLIFRGHPVQTQSFEFKMWLRSFLSVHLLCYVCVTIKVNKNSQQGEPYTMSAIGAAYFMSPLIYSFAFWQNGGFSALAP